MYNEVYPNYQAAPNSDPNGSVDIIFYNDTGGTLTNGIVKMLSFEVAANAAGDPVLYPIVKTAQTEAVAVVEIVVVNDPNGSVADATWGLARKKGVVQANCDGTADIALGDQLEVITDGTAFIVGAQASSGDAGSIIDECAAIAMIVYTGATVATKTVCLLGKQVVVKGS
jgi:hypothetical protein